MRPLLALDENRIQERRIVRTLVGGNGQLFVYICQLLYNKQPHPQDISVIRSINFLPCQVASGKWQVASGKW